MQTNLYFLPKLSGTILIGSLLLTGCGAADVAPAALSYPAYAGAGNPRPLATAPNGNMVYPHDKVEGLVIINNTMLVTSDDGDFGVPGNDWNGFAPKVLPTTGKVDLNRMYFVPLKTPLK